MNNITVIDEDSEYWIVLLNEKKYHIYKSENIINLGRGVVFHANYQLEKDSQGISQMVIIGGQTTEGYSVLHHRTFYLQDDQIDNENMNSQLSETVAEIDDGDDDIYDFNRCVKKAEIDLRRNMRSKYFSMLIQNSGKFTDNEKDVFGSLSRRYRSHFLKEEFISILNEIDPKNQLDKLYELEKQKNRFYGIPEVLKPIKQRIKGLESFLGIKPKKTMKKMMPANKHDSIERGTTMLFKGEERVIDGVGKVFMLESNDFSRLGFTQGDQVFWIYFEENNEQNTNLEKPERQSISTVENTSNINENFKIECADAKDSQEFFNAIKDYYNIIAFIKTNGIKPRHTINEVKEIKQASIICDGRKKLEGISWIAYNEDTLWFISNKLSPVGFENNMKIYDQHAQCWRISMRYIKDKIQALNHINEVVFISDLIPNE